MNLNEMIEAHLHARYRNWEGNIELSPEIKREYEGRDNLNLGQVISNILKETKEHRNGNKKVITYVKENKEIFEIYSEGTRLNDKEINFINERYTKGERSSKLPSTGGTLIIGFYVNQIEGKISIENCFEPPYTLKNKLILDK